MSDSSTELEDKEAGASAQQGEGSGTPIQEQKGAPAVDSPPADLKQDDNKPKSTEEAVRLALGLKGKEQSSGSDEGEDGESTATKAAADAEAKKPGEGEENDADLIAGVTQEELNRLKPKTRRRMEAFIREVKVRDEKITQLVPAAEFAETIINRVNQAGLTKVDLNNTFSIAEAIKKDPVRGLQLLEPIVAQLRTFVGEELPEDLALQVGEGKITEDAAKELSRLRSQNRIVTHTSAQREQELQTERQNNDLQKVAGEVDTAVSDWYRKWKASDPDHRVKDARVMERIELELTRAQREEETALRERRKPQLTVPQDAKQAVALAEKCRKAVEEEMKKLLPRRAPIHDPAGVSTNPGSKPKPKSSLEAVDLALGL